jgi:hypothetical protein
MLLAANGGIAPFAAPLTAHRLEVALIADSRCQAFVPKDASLDPALFTGRRKTSAPA